MNQFDYVRPSTVAEAIALAAEPGAAFLAGGSLSMASGERPENSGGITPNLVNDNALRVFASRSRPRGRAVGLLAS
jgi:hypothetical protein